MAKLCFSRTTLRRAASQHAIPCILIIFALASTALAVPVTYSGFTITDGQLGAWSFTNARVFLTFQTDTQYVQQTVIAGVNVAYVGPFSAQQLCTGTPSSVGTARVTIVSGRKTVRATFAPNQIFVSLDKDNGGVGFGSCGPAGFEPAYPMGLAGGTIFGATNAPLFGPSVELAALPIDLVHNVGFSGRAWVCVGFPTLGKQCSPPNPLQTDKGTLLLTQPYQAISPGPPPSFNDTISGGLFYAVLGEDQINWDGAMTSRTAPITYKALVIADVTLGASHFNGALVYLSFASDPRSVLPFSDASSYGYINQSGAAKVTIITGDGNLSASFNSHQLYVYFDIKNSAVGFGSGAGGRGYPLALTATEPPNSIYGFENSTLGAVGNILRTHDDLANYTPLTQTLVTDLTNATTLSGNGSSCGALDPTTAICSNLVPTSLNTDHGAFYLYEPYTNDSSGNGTQPYSDNFAVFWSEPGVEDE